MIRWFFFSAFFFFCLFFLIFVKIIVEPDRVILTLRPPEELLMILKGDIRKEIFVEDRRDAYDPRYRYRFGEGSRRYRSPFGGPHRDEGEETEKYLPEEIRTLEKLLKENR